MRFCHAILNNHEVPTGFLRCCRVLKRDGFGIRKIGIVGVTDYASSYRRMQC